MFKEHRVKKVALIVVAAMLVAGIAVYAAGCGSSTASAGITEAQLGAPIYPGATKVDASTLLQQGGGMRQFQGSRPQFPGSAPGFQGSRPQFQGSRPNFSGSAPNGGLRSQNMTGLWTPDAPDKVAAWYKSKLSGKPGFSERSMPTQFMSQAGGQTTRYTFTSGSATKSVTIRNDLRGKGGTLIMVGNVPAGFPANPQSNQVQ
jgi:hypothetical protein